MLKPLLGPCDSYQLEPFSYEWAWIMSRQQESNTWSPDEISVASDIADYKNPDLDPKYRHLFDAVMAQLTTFDIERGDDAAETFLSIMQPAEIRHYLKRLVWDEALHTRAYRYVIENLGIPLTIYDRWKEVPAMKARVEMAQEISAPLLKVMGWMYLNDEPMPQGTWIKSKQEILRSMIFWFLIFEGVWFWVNLLGPIQQLSRLGRFKGAAEQFQYIARDEQSHIGFGHRLISEFMVQYPECLTEQFLTTVVNDTERAIQLEADFAAYCLKDGPILGYSVPEHVATAKLFANMRLGSVGLPQPFDDAQHCFPWMSEQNELRKEKNWFEKKPTEYQVGALQFDDLSHHDGWDDPLKELTR
jgi:ribonucleoside-diphosphate reductase beta chain